MPEPAAVVLWVKVIEIVRLVFEDGELPPSFIKGIFVLILKADAGEYLGIALLEIIYKLISSIINIRLIHMVKFDDSMHGNLPGQSTAGTVIMEAKLLAHLRCRIDEPLFMVFVDLKKAYYLLDREQAMCILEEYGFGVSICRIIRLIWQGDTRIPRKAGYYGTPFEAKRGL